jgi:drug/metabolite transporter (DMT)-like permease
MKPNKLMVAGLVVTLVGLLIVVRHEMGIPSYWTPLLVGIGLLIAGAVCSMICGKSKTS